MNTYLRFDLIFGNDKSSLNLFTFRIYLFTEFQLKYSFWSSFFTIQKFCFEFAGLATMVSVTRLVKTVSRMASGHPKTK